MLSFPFEIPPSLYSYLEKFEEHPERITEKLATHLSRRGQNPIDQFLLAWLYLHQEDKESALKHAIKAKAFAPGSTLLEYLPYFIRHPESFNAWQPSTKAPDEQVTESVFSQPRYPESDMDLDALIEQISRVDPEKMGSGEWEAVDEETEQKDLSAGTDDVDDIVSETLATIYEKQNQFQQAIRVYRQLIELHPENREKYTQAIDRLEKRMELDDESE
jgi:tetratricopeptide (TPR) repeat protein